MRSMKALSVAQAASFLGVSDDTVRRWIAAGRLTEHRDRTGRGAVDALELAQLARSQEERQMLVAGVVKGEAEEKIMFHWGNKYFPIFLSITAGAQCDTV